MPPPPERVVLFRSGRHLQVALDALRREWPGCDVTVVATPAAGPALDAAGIGTDHRVIYDATDFFRPWPFLTSAAWRVAAGKRFDRVCVLWNDPDGRGQTNVDYTAMTLAPAGFTAITPDGTLVPRRTGANLQRALSRAAASMAVGAVLAALWVPARAAACARAAFGRQAES